MGDTHIDPVKYFLSGGFGGICTVLAGHPLDTIKVRLQTMPKPGPGEYAIYNGTIDCFNKIVAQEGVAGLYKGISAPLISVAPIFAISFLTFGVGKRLQQRVPNEELTLPQFFLAGAFSGLCCTFVMAPGERIKCLLQIQSSSGGPQQYSGMFDTASKLYKEGGMASIFKGTCATLLRDVPAAGTYFMTYEYVQRLLTPIDPLTGKPGPVGFVSTVFAGGMAGMANWVVGMPADVLKSRLQTAPRGTYPKGVRSVFGHMMKTEGPLALYTGIIPVMLRAFPANAACFMGFEGAMRFLNWVAETLKQ